MTPCAPNAPEAEGVHPLGFLRSLLLAALAFFLASPAAAAEPLPPELTPYRVSLSLDLPDSPDCTAPFRRTTAEDIRRLIHRTYGERWTLTDAPLSLTRDDLDALTPDAVGVERGAPAAGQTRGLPADTAPEKALFVAVRPDGPGFVASAREWDRLTDTLGPVRTQRAATRAAVPRAALKAITASFRPVASIGTSDGSTAALTFRAGGIPTPDPAAGAVEPGTLFAPVLRRTDKDGSLIEVRSVPLTLLRVTKVAGAAATAEVASALRSPLGARRGRVEAWAIASPPVADSTRLTIARRDDGVPLVGRAVQVRFSPFTPGKEEPPPERTLLTDRSGSLTLTPVPKHPLLWLTVKSGDATLLRLPVAPGVEPAVTVPLGDDQRRLDAEARLSILIGDLIETVAKRATLLATARSTARAGQYPKADAALADATKLPDSAAFRRRLAAVETPAAKAAEEDRDRLAAARIRALGRQAAGLIDRYLNPDALRVIREEVEELKRTDPDLNAPKQPAATPPKTAPPKTTPAKPTPKPETKPPQNTKPATPPAKQPAAQPKPQAPPKPAPSAPNF